MEIGILKFDHTHKAAKALSEVREKEEQRRPYLAEVGVIERNLVGRVAIRASYEDQMERVGAKKLREIGADLGALTGYFVGSLVGPMAALMAAGAGEEAGVEGTNELVEEIKSRVPRGSSCLVLVADSKTIDDMASAFAQYKPQVTRRSLDEGTQGRLESMAGREESRAGAPTEH